VIVAVSASVSALTMTSAVPTEAPPVTVPSLPTLATVGTVLRHSTAVPAPVAPFSRIIDTLSFAFSPLLSVSVFGLTDNEMILPLGSSDVLLQPMKGRRRTARSAGRLIE
jgi:hypothetical protein